jgi:hypothetical protein
MSSQFSLINATPITAGPQVVFIDTGLANYQQLIDELPADIEVRLVSPEEDGIQSIAEWAVNHSGYSAIHILGHGASGIQQLGSARLSQEALGHYQKQLSIIGESLTETGDILLYGCNVGAGIGGLDFIGSLAEATGADIAASNDLTGSGSRGGDWDLESSTASVSPTLSFNQYSSTLALDAVIDYLDSLYVRPNETSYIWTWGIGTAYDSGTSSWYDAAITQVSMDNVPDPGFEWYLDRGSFQYSTDSGSNWTTYNMGDGFTNVAGTLWRFVDTQTHTNDDHIGFYYYVSGAAAPTGGSGLFIKVDEAPTDVNSSNTAGILVSDTPDGEVVTTFDPVDTGYSRDGVWVLESQSHAGLFSLQSDTSSNDQASLLLNTAHLPADGTDVNVTVRYYDIYQLDRNGTPLSGEGVAKTYTYTVKGPSNDLGFSNETTVNSLVGDTENQDFSSVTELTTGNFVITWSDNTNGGVYAQLYNASGAAQGSAITVDSNVTYKSDAVALSGGKYAIFYVGATSYDIAFRIIQADGTVGAEVTVASAEWDQWSFLNAYPSGDGSSFTLSWNTDDYSTLKQATFSDTGTQIGSTSTLTPTGYSPISATLNNGDVITAVGDAATWEGLNLLINDVAIQATYDTPIGDTATQHSLTALPGGGFVLAWVDSTSAHIQFQVFDNTGTATSGIIQANTVTAGSVASVKVSAFTDGSSFVVTWDQGDVDGSGSAVQGRRFLSDGAAIDTDQFQINQYRYGNQHNSDVTALSNGTFVTTWTDGSDSATGTNIELRIAPSANNAPMLGGTPADETVIEDVATAIDLSAYDISDAEGDTVTLTLAVDTGTIATTDGNGVTASVTIANSGTSSMTLQGTAADLNFYLNDTSRIEYTTASNSTSTATLTVTPSDGSLNGTPDSVFISVTAVNDAPLLADTSVTLSAIAEDAGDDDGSGEDGDNDSTHNADNPGNTIASILTAAISDPDGVAVEAIAVTAVDNTHGVWQYSTDGGSTWNNFSATTGSIVDISSAARLLDSANTVRFVPDAEYSGSTTFTFRAWDKTSGSVGATADTTTNGGSSAFSMATDTASVTVTSINDAPQFTGLNGTPAYTEGAGAVILDSDVAVSDVELDSLNGGNGDYTGASLNIVRNGGAYAVDTFSITSGGNLSVAGSNISAGGNVIATFDTGSAGQVTITFVDNGTTPTTALVNEVMQAVLYTNTSDDPAANVQLDWTFADGNSGNAQGTGDNPGTASGSTTVSITNVNDAPTLTATGQDPTYIEGAAAADLYSGVSADTIETTNTTDRFSSMTLTVTNLADGAAEVLRIDGTDLALTNGNAATTSTNSLDVEVSVTGSTATVSVTNGSLTNAQMQTLVDSLAYRNTSDNPTTAGNRVVTITGITDNGGTDNSGSDSATPNLTSTVSLTAVNDAPVIANLDGDSVVLEPATATGIDQNGDLTLSNVDSADYNGGSLTLTDNGANNTVNGNFSVDGTHVTAGGDAAIAAGETLSVGGTAIGTVHATNDGQGGNTLEIDFNGNATNARVETLLRNLEWSAAAGTGNQTFTATLNDADGTSDSGDQDTTANFTMILGNAPVIGNLNGDSVTFADGGSAVTVDQNTDSALSDLDNPTSFNGGSLNVSVSANKVADEDLLTFDTSGAVSLAGTTAGSNVSVSGTVIGTLANNMSAGNDLVVNLNSDATIGRVQNLLQAVAYDNVDDLPTVSDRTVSVSVTDTLGISSALANITVSVTSINEAPAFTGVDATPTFTEDGSAVVLDGNMSIADPELDTLNNYDGATLTLSRAGGANTNDSFGSSGTLSALTEGQTFQVGATTIGTVTTHSAGQLSLAFNTNATTSLVNAALQQITYSNASNMPASSVTIDLLFDDGNTGGQGSGPNLTDSDDSITVDIVVVNDAPQISSAGGFDPLFTAGNAAVRLFTGTVVDPIEVGQTIDEVVLTATNISDSGKEFLVVDGTDIDLTANGSTAVGSYSVTVTTGSPTRITIDTSGGNNTPSEISSLISNLDYRNDAEPLTVATRDFTLTSVTDDGGQLNGGNDTANGLTLTSTVTTTNNTAPEITSHGGASFIYIGASENQSDVTQVTATDDDGDDLTFMLSGGADQSLFDIDPLTGELAFKNPVDFESPSDQDGNNEYEVEVTVSDGRGGTDVIGFIAVVADQNDAPQIASPASPVSISENTLNVLVADVSDQDGDNLTFSISGGDDAALFTIDSSGSLRFKQSQNFEQPSDANNDGLYSVEYTVTDPEGASDSQFVTVRVSDVNEAPTIISQGGSGSAQVYPQELGRYVMTVVGEDEEGDALSYSISGEDSELFNISPDTGILSFKTPPDFESPADADHDNAYHLTNTVTDSFGLQDSQNVVVYVQNRNEQPAFDGESVFNGPENETPVILLADHDPDGDALTYRITGGEDADAFTIHGDGTLSLKDTPDFESPTDANGDNIYRVEVEGRDSGGLYYRQNLSYTVADIAEAPVFITETSVFLVTENSTTVGMIEARDPDQNGALTYRIAGGADGSLFQMDVDGNLSFITPPDFESPRDQGSDNVYAVTVIATDIDGDESVRDFTVEVTDVEESEPDIPDEAEWDTLPDDDGDGIPEQVEDFVPSPHGGSDGDGNGDGVRDKDQRSVASTPFRNTDKVTENPDAPHTFITLEVSSDDNSDPTTERAAIQQTVQRDAPNDKPGDIDMPLGLIDFTVTSRNVGQMESFSLFVDNDIRLNGYYKQNAEGQWVNIANNIEHVGNKIRIDFNIRDGGEFDEDGEANGVIVDPGALGYQAPAPVTADDQLATLYITYYDRAPDAEGYAYWKNMMEQHGWSLYDVSRGFAEHPRFAQEYAGQSDEEIAAKLYINTFGIEGEQDGIDFWTEQIGQRPLHEVIADFNVSGLNLDLTALYEQGQLSEEVYTLAYQRQSVLKNLIKTSMDFVDIFGDATIPASQADQLSGDPAYKAAIAALEQVSQDPVTAYEARDQMLALVGAADPMQGLLDLWIT